MKFIILWSLFSSVFFIGCPSTISFRQGDMHEEFTEAMSGPAFPVGSRALVVTAGDLVGIAAGYDRTSHSDTVFFNIPLDFPTGTYSTSILIEDPTGMRTFAGSSSFDVVVHSRPSTVFYVDQSNPTPSTGTSWKTAFNEIFEGIAAAAASGGEVWVAEGTYFPEISDRSATIQLASGVHLYGGFPAGGSAFSDRDWTANQTILSGEINSSSKEDNCYHVVTGSNLSILDGFVIRDGYANGERENRLGGGLYADQASPIINHCLFTANYAEEGGAAYIVNTSNPTFSNCTFEENEADKGGAVLCRYDANAYLDSCLFNNNRGNWRGGALYIDYGSNPSIVDCDFTRNWTGGNGGAVYIDDLASQFGGTRPVFKGCTFEKNRANYRGGAMCVFNDNAEPVVYACDFIDNKANEGGGAVAIDYNAYLVFIDPCTFSGNDGGSGDDDYHRIEGGDFITY